MWGSHFQSSCTHNFYFADTNLFSLPSPIATITLLSSSQNATIDNQRHAL